MLQAWLWWSAVRKSQDSILRLCGRTRMASDTPGAAQDIGIALELAVIQEHRSTSCVQHDRNRAEGSGLVQLLP